MKYSGTSFHYLNLSHDSGKESHIRVHTGKMAVVSFITRRGLQTQAKFCQTLLFVNQTVHRQKWL